MTTSDHDRGERVEPERDVGREARRRRSRCRRVVQHGAPRRAGSSPCSRSTAATRDHERGADDAGPDELDAPCRGARGADERVPEERRAPAGRRSSGASESARHHRSVVSSSALTVSRLRKTLQDDREADRGLGRRDGHHEEHDHLPVHRAAGCARSATNARFTAFSMSSIDMKMTITLRRTRTPDRADREEDGGERRGTRTSGAALGHGSLLLARARRRRRSRPAAGRGELERQQRRSVKSRSASASVAPKPVERRALAGAACARRRRVTTSSRGATPPRRPRRATSAPARSACAAPPGG